MPLHTAQQLINLVSDLIALPSENQWVEFKHNNSDPEMIGKNISALANAAAVHSQPYGYLVWGVDDVTHEIIGTNFSPSSTRVKQQEMSHYFSTQLNPQIYFEFEEVEIDNHTVAVLVIESANQQPVKYNGIEYIRVGSNTKLLSKHADQAQRLWKSFERLPFEDRIAKESVTQDEVLVLLDYPSYFTLLRKPLPDNRQGIFEALKSDGLITKTPGKGWCITNLGAILFANDLVNFPSLSRRALRVIHFKGTNRLETLKELGNSQGYASGFAHIIRAINDLLPVNEAIGQALRAQTPVYPELAVRELVANALIHQDFSVSGSAPTVSLFEDRLEITNPGVPLVPLNRLIDAPPRSRNDKLAAFMRRIGVCEEQGSGWDKVVFQIEYFQLPAPLVAVRNDNMHVTMFSQRRLTNMEGEDRIRAVYLHSCLRYTEHKKTNNASIRERFGIPERNKATASRLLKEAVEAGVIAPHDPSAATKLMRYVPFWAAPDRPVDLL